MKPLFYSLFILFVSFNTANSQSSTNYYGEEFSVLGVKDYSINKKGFLNNTQDLIKIEAEILSTCPMKGCWMKIKAEEDTILVRFKDYGFFVPKDGVIGNKTIINGKLSVDTLSVALLRHYAEDAGKSKEEIDKIIDPEISMTFLANGVMIKEE
tara:strand:+ start:97 stop:558 length:462 start_codon:yes stop_codon:yes gene_type:complete